MRHEFTIFTVWPFALSCIQKVRFLQRFRIAMARLCGKFCVASVRPPWSLRHRRRSPPSFTTHAQYSTPMPLHVDSSFSSMFGCFGLRFWKYIQRYRIGFQRLMDKLYLVYGFNFSCKDSEVGCVCIG
ncbi:hypothetical protein Salat_2064800 [Sesamum alatum]|uniref:Uncharacterized protein n=1 Tax=Sesamum alatum TaxID=300844 RepID=A0AAE2CGC5_9LAMI|nr:hypothetical protein Salat_2064800 [Sesamum alatum]